MISSARITGAAIMLLTIMFAFGCATRPPYSSEMFVNEVTKGENDELTYAFEVAERAETATMSLRVLGSGGAAIWTLLDPRETVRWEGRAQGNVQIDDERSFPAIPGEWTIKWVVEDFKGEYAFGLRAGKK